MWLEYFNLHERRCENQKSRNINPDFLVNCINLRISFILAYVIVCNPAYTSTLGI